MLLLCVTGVALNHTSSLGLDQRFAESRWLLGIYGISGPEFGPSYAVADRWITLAGGRLYLDDREILRSVGADVVGAVYLDNEIVVAGPDELIHLDAQGALLERSPLSTSLPGPLDGIAVDAGAVYLRSAGSAFVYNPLSASVAAASADEVPVWSGRQPLPQAVRIGIERTFRGSGISIERLLADLHSGRLFGLGGRVFMDLTALALCILALSGILLFVRR